ncbi:MAG: polysaccharide deacetylase family protein, partial [Nitrococcus sp.]|nr:polysaccharide deacetylase family protein [Nitrococcus sp.]
MPERRSEGRRPPTWLTVSAVVHAAALALLILRPDLWRWAFIVLAANHTLLMLAGLCPRSRLLGPNLTRLPENGPPAVALTFDDGPDPEVTPEVLRLLAEHGARATFFCIGARAEAHPKLVRAIAAAGHRVGNHSQRHLVRFALLGPWAMAREIGHAQQILAALGDEAPHYFRAPAGIRNPFTGMVLAHLGLRLVSWTRRGFDTVTRDPE